MLHAAIVRDSRFTSMLVTSGRPGRLLDDSQLFASYAPNSSFTSFPDLFADSPEMQPARLAMLELVETFAAQTWALVTRYPENIMAMLPSSGFWRDDNDRLPANLMLGTVVNNQREAEQRVPALLRVPAQTRFVSHIELNGPIPYPLNGAYRHLPGNAEQLGDDMLQCPRCGAGVWESEPSCACGHQEKTTWEVRDLIHFVQLPDPLHPAVNQKWAQQLRLDYGRAGVPVFGERSGDNADAA